MILDFWLISNISIFDGKTIPIIPHTPNHRHYLVSSHMELKHSIICIMFEVYKKVENDVKFTPSAK